MKVAPLNRWDFYKILGTRIVAFGLIFNPVEFLQVSRKKRRSSTVQLGQKGHSAAGPGEISPAHGRLRARQVSNLMGGARMSSLTLRQRADELTGSDAGHGEGMRGHG